MFTQSQGQCGTVGGCGGFEIPIASGIVGSVGNGTEDHTGNVIPVGHMGHRCPFHFHTNATAVPEDFRFDLGISNKLITG